MATFYITGVEPDGRDQNRVNDAVYGKDFYISMEKAVFLVRAGVKFRTLCANNRHAPVYAQQSLSGNWYLKTSPDAYIANNIGTIASRPRASTLLSGGIRRNAFSR